MSSVQVFDSKRSMRQKFTEATERLSAMATLGQVPMLLWESDDSPEEYRFTELMIDYAASAGGRVIRLDTFNVYQLELHTEVSSGKFLYIAE